jgi:hypothetical protein
VAARFECHVRGCACNWFFRGAKGGNFRVCLTGALVPTLADDPVALGYDTANPGVGMSCLNTPLGQRERACHSQSIEFTEHYFTAIARP